MKRILYITYDGLTDPLGQSQILAYLKRLANTNQIVLFSYEKKQLLQKQKHEIEKITKENNIIWVSVKYTKTPPVFSTLYDINKGIRLCKRLHRKYNFQIVHCRGYIPAIIGRRLKNKFGTKFIFDMRGWWADEKLESGYWDKIYYKPVYWYFKKLERKFFKECDFGVSLTYSGKEEIISKNLAASNKIGVIPTCVDFEIFKPWNAEVKKNFRSRMNINETARIFVYSGSVGGNYEVSTLLKAFKIFSKIYPDSFLLILSKDEYDKSLLEKLELARIKFEILSVPFLEVTNYLRASDVGFIYYKMSFSTIGRSPTKLGEYWASGIPVISFKGIGDLDFILDKYPDAGVLLSGNENKWEEEMNSLKFNDHNTLRKYAEDYFHINKGVTFYQHVYETLISSKKP